MFPKSTFLWVPLLLFLLISSFAYAVTEIPAGAVEDGALDATIAVAPAHMNAKQGTVAVSADVRPDGQMELFVAERRGGAWHVLKEIGKIGSESVVNFELGVKYASKSSDERAYMLIGQEDGKYVGRQFAIALDWTGYEASVRNSISNANAILVPLLGIAIALLIMVLFEFAYVRRSQDEVFEGEYTTTSLFFPVVRRRPPSEIIADLFINPLFIVFELACIGVFAMLILSYSISIYGEETGLRLFLMTGLGALSIPLILMALAWLADIYHRGPLRFVVAAFIWGAFAAVGSFLISSLASNFIGTHISPADAATASFAVMAAALMAPVIEETLKSLGVIVLAGHHEYKDVVDGIIYGFVIGCGFAFLENWFYFIARGNPFELGVAAWFDFVAYRLLFSALSHGTFTAACGAFIGYFKSDPRLRRYTRLAYLPGLLIAISLHSLFNISAILDEIEVYFVRVPIFIFNPAMVLTLALSLLVVFYFASMEAKKRMLEEKARIAKYAH